MSIRSRFYVHWIFFTYAASIAPIVHADTWHPPYADNGTVGSVLEDRFNELLKQCKIGYPLRKTVLTWHGEVLSDPISSIPAALQGGALPLTAEFLQVKTLSAARLFAYLYKDTEQKASFTENGSQNLSEADFAGDAAEFLIKGGIDVVYKQTCGSVLSAAANASSEWSVPAAAMSAALQSDFNNKNRNVFLLTYGSLHSPLANLIESGDPYKKLNGNLMIWEWYARGGADSVSYLRELPAVVLYEYSATDNTTGGTVNLKGRAGITSIGISGKIDASFSNDLSYTLSQNRTILLKPKTNDAPWGDFKTAPTIDAIVTASGAARGRATTVTSIISPGIEYVHTQTFPGAQNKCDSRLWDIKYPLAGDVSKGMMAIKSTHVTNDRDGQPDGCAFEIGFTPFANVTSASLNFNLRYLYPASGKFIELPAARLDLSASAAPYLTRTTDNRWWTKGASVILPNDTTDTSVQWVIKYTVDEDDADQTDGKNPKIGSVALECPGDLKPFINKSVKYDTTTTELTLTLNATIQSRDNLDIDGKVTPIQCSLIGTADFSMRTPAGAHRVQKQPLGQGIVLFYPAPNPKQAAPLPTPAPAVALAPAHAPAPAPAQ
jgi:hypothetical protein